MPELLLGWSRDWWRNCCEVEPDTGILAKLEPGLVLGLLLELERGLVSEPGLLLGRRRGLMPWPRTRARTRTDAELVPELLLNW